MTSVSSWFVNMVTGVGSGKTFEASATGSCANMFGTFAEATDSTVG